VADSPRIEELKRRVQSDPASIAFAALAEEYRRAERFEEAIATCTAGLVRHPSYLSAHVTLGRALIEVGRLEGARAELEYVLKLAPENLAAIRGLAEIHNRIGADASEHTQPEEHAAAAAPDDSSMSIAEIQAASGASSPDRSAENPPPATVEVNAVTAQVSTAAGDMIRPYSQPAGATAPDVAQSRPIEVHRPPIDPALAGLEEFLRAIHRARSRGAASR
jgi:tetratricopeptide (TPR) repeat protein